MKAAKIYAVAVSGLIAGLIAHAWAAHPEIRANGLHAENCRLWHAMSKKNYEVTMARLALRFGEDAR